MSNSVSDLSDLNLYQLKVQGLISKAKLNFLQSIVDNIIKDNLKAFFLYARFKQKVKGTVLSPGDPNGDD